MKLIEYNVSNSAPAPYNGEPTVRLNRSSGLIKFNKSASKMLGLKSVSRIVFVCDEKHKEDWFISKSGIEGFKVHPESGSECFTINNKNICRTLFIAIAPGFKSQYKACSFKLSLTPVEQEGKTYWPIITSFKINAK